MMPQLGETVTEGTITRWMKSVGDPVERDEPLFEVSTDKVDSEVPSPAAGVLTEILVPEGETVEVGVRLAVIGDGAGSSAAGGTPAAGTAEPPAPQPEPATAAPPPPPPAPAPAATPAPAPAAGAADGNGSEPLAAVTDRAQAPGRERHQRVGGDGDRSRRAHHAGGRAAGGRVPPFGGPDGHTGATAARRTIVARGTGHARRASDAGGQRAAGTSESPWRSFRRAGDQLVPFSNMRRRTAEHMVRSKATSPHAFIANEVDFESVERVRAAWGERFKAEEGFALTYLPFVARAAVEALRDFPLLNASVVDDSLLVHSEVNLGIAVDLSHEGLIVPVIHRAEEVTLRGVARRIRDLAERARGRQLNADDIAGGTFSITNDGPFGTYFTVPIINQPQVAILATDGIARRPVVVTQPDGSESIAIHSTGILGVSWDHRAVDGAYVSLFLARISELLGSRDWAAEL